MLSRRIKNRMSFYARKIAYRMFMSKHMELWQADRIFTHLSDDEKRKLFELAKMVRGGGSIVEIGSFLGASACFFAAGAGKNVRVFCIDTWENDAMSEGKRDTHKEFFANTARFRDKILEIQNHSTHAIGDVKKMMDRIDLLFIDGDHSYDGCKLDWDLYSPLLHSGSCIVMHDYGWADGVKRVVEEDIKPRCRDFNTLPNMFWGYIA